MGVELRNWLIKKLGGLTIQEVENWAPKSDPRDGEILYLRQAVADWEARYLELQSVILEKSGFVHVPNNQSAPQPHKPIGNKPPWVKERQRLEQRDRKLAAEMQTQTLEDFYKKRGAKTQEEFKGETNANSIS